ncbi:uncharacterized protein LOC105437527 [Strongylocentrotus purpuratus]|uniref:Uncharacterized protein n=1 Tax=Strongylocentrotus purpuratus TaxID=7668 RepID=A0A7M7HCB9_STRPU|nr:uncharacterized protein LOC105437527 [Strongylocentrotus purpuratus]|eukprot:XP_011662501.1 PREDICTED: uncharacterized protein LOC105437527 [Strongylocentrotus purpuratus]
MLRNWSARKRNRQKRQQRQRNQCETQHSPHHGLEEATQDTAVSQRQEDATPIETDDTSLSSTSSEYINSQTSVYQGGLLIGIKPIDENDDNLAMPLTSGLSCAQSRTDAAPVESEQIPEHRKRIYSDDDDEDDDDGVNESLEQRPRKRRAKTDRQPTSP